MNGLFPGPHDKDDAILVIHAGAGGAEARDWTGMLLRMYLCWAEGRGYEASVLDSISGEEAGLKRAILRIEGDHVYGYLRPERGIHRLVRVSPFDAAGRRHISFALVEVWPDIGEEIEVDIEADWGNPLRSYVLHPYKMVKDLRTGYETENVKAVLNGDLDDFIEGGTAGN